LTLCHCAVPLEHGPERSGVSSPMHSIRAAFSRCPGTRRAFRRPPVRAEAGQTHSCKYRPRRADPPRGQVQRPVSLAIIASPLPAPRRAEAGRPPGQVQCRQTRQTAQAPSGQLHLIATADEDSCPPCEYGHGGPTRRSVPGRALSQREPTPKASHGRAVHGVDYLPTPVPGGDRDVELLRPVASRALTRASSDRPREVGCVGTATTSV
jgi:hypothetical protein